VLHLAAVVIRVVSITSIPIAFFFYAGDPARLAVIQCWYILNFLAI